MNKWIYTYSFHDGLRSVVDLPLVPRPPCPPPPPPGNNHGGRCLLCHEYEWLDISIKSQHCQLLFQFQHVLNVADNSEQAELRTDALWNASNSIKSPFPEYSTAKVRYGTL